MTADIKDAHSGFNRLSNAVNDFTQKNMSLNGIMMQAAGALGKLGVAFGAAEVASKAFNAMLDGSQAFGDKVRNSMTALNTTLGTLASSFATIDFSPIENGLGSLVARAYDAANAMDRLWNVTQSVGLIQSGNNLKFQQSMTMARDKSLPMEERKEWFRQAEGYLKDTEETISYQFAATMEAIRKDIAAELNVSVDKISADVVRAAAAAQGSAAGTARMNEAIAAMATKPVDRGRGTKMYAASLGAPARRDDGFEQERMAWQDNHLEDLIYNAVNNRKTDEELQKLIQLLMSSDQLALRREELKRQTFEVRGQLTPTGGGGSNGSGKSYESKIQIDDVVAKKWDPIATTQSLKELNTQLERYKQLAASATNPIDAMAAAEGIKRTQELIDAQPLAISVGMDAESVAQLNADVNSLTEQMKSDMKPLEVDVSGVSGLAKDGYQSADAWQAAAQSVSNVAGALQQMDNKGANVAGIVMQAVANVALGFAQASASPATGAAGIFGWIAAATAGLATMTATIVSIKNATKGSFAEGGIVPGTYNGGIDSSYVYASPGEVILNRAQQQNLLGQLESGGQGGGEAYVRGETMFLAISNYMKRTGKRFG